jgi:integrase/recombinase XerC/integrase/recombinase XerD
MSNQHYSQQKTRLADLIEYYETCNRSEGKSPKTVEWYSTNLRAFNEYLADRSLPDSIEGIDITTLRKYSLYLLSRKKFSKQHGKEVSAEQLSPATVHGHIRTLRAFFSWLEREEFTDKNLGRRLKLPKVPRHVISTLSEKEIKAIMETLGENHNHGCDTRNKTIFMMLLDTGIRIGELVSLNMDDLHLREGYFKVMGKGQKERIVPIGQNAQRALQKYLFRYRPDPANPWIKNVFLSIQGNPVTINSMKLMFVRLAKKAGVQRLHAHLCRHTFATMFLANGGDIFTLQQILGHSTLEMVRLYANLTSNHIVAQHQRYSPLDRLRMQKF